MSDNSLPLQQLCDVAIQAARKAGQFIQSVDRTQLQGNFKAAGSSGASQLVTEVDIQSEAIIREYLQPTFEQWDIAFVGEESSPSVSDVIPERLQKPYFWCVDPLDGTLPFVEGTDGYAVSIALVDQSGSSLIGVVYDPVDASLIHAIKGLGACRNFVPMVMEAKNKPIPTPLVAFADASFRALEKYDDIVGVLNACAFDVGLNSIDIIYGSGAVKNASQVLDSAAACYVKPPKAEDGGGSIWDYAATACIVSEAGGWVSNIYGQPLELNRQDSTFMNHQGVLYASSQRIARYLIDKL